MFEDIIFVVVTGSALWVYYDATKNKIGSIPGEKEFTNANAESWATSTLLLWIIAFPIYLFNRSQLIEKAKTYPIESSQWRNTFFVLFSILFLGSIINLATNPELDYSSRNPKTASQTADQRYTESTPVKQNNESNVDQHYTDSKPIIQNDEFNSQSQTKINASDWFDRAQAKYNLNDYQGAIADYTEAISLKSDFVNAYSNRGLAKYNLDDYQGAIADYNKAISLKSDIGEVYFNRGLARGKLEDYQGALVDFTKANKLKPDNAEIYYNRGLTKGKLQDFQGALADFTKTIKLMPDAEEAYYNRGIAYLGLGLKSKARADLMRAIELGYRVPQVALDMCK